MGRNSTVWKANGHHSSPLAHSSSCMELYALPCFSASQVSLWVRQGGGGMRGTGEKKVENPTGAGRE